MFRRDSYSLSFRRCLMRRFRWLALALLLIVVPAAPSAATVATIVMTAPLEDHDEQSVTAALRAAVQAAVAGAAAMGLPWVQISQALVLDDAVAVQIVATDEDLEPDTGEDAPDPESGADADGREPAEGKI
jgi:hypothetical protein